MSPNDGEAGVGAAPLARSADLSNTLPKPEDPTAAYIDLMEALEALGTKWPARSFRRTDSYRL